MRSQLDPSALGHKRMLMLRAIHACWLAHGQGPKYRQLQALGGWPEVKHRSLMGTLAAGGWITGHHGVRHSTRLTPAAYRALGWDEPVILANKAGAFLTAHQVEGVE